MMLWIEFDLIFAFFFMQVITIVFLHGVLDGFFLQPLLHEGDHHDVLDGVGLELCLLLHAGDPHAVLGEFDSIFTFFCLQVSIMIHDVLD